MEGSLAVTFVEEKLPLAVYPNDGLFQKKIPIQFNRVCDCSPNKLNCMNEKEWKV